MSSTVFISYSHRDMTPTNWLEKLKNYLAAFQQKGVVDTWDDTRLQVGQEWRVEIGKALEKASAAVLLVGPAFLASDFITKHELPPLLAAAKYHGKKIFPLIIGYCAYKESGLEPYQAFNDPDKPLEALAPHEQNKLLNDLSILVAKEVDKSLQAAKSFAQPPFRDLVAGMKQILQNLDDTHTAFQAQARRRDHLVEKMKQRLDIQERMEYEVFFFHYYDRMNVIERFDFKQIRAITEGTLHNRNRNTLQILNDNPALLDAGPALTDLRQHLVFWLNKFDKIFTKTEAMCLLYAGVEDGVPFPFGIEQQIRAWLEQKETTS